MNPIDDLAHIIQLSTAPVFLLMGIATTLNVLSGRLARILDRSRVLEQKLETPELHRASLILSESRALEKRGRLIYHAIKLSTASALLVCALVAALFASSISHYSTRLIVSGLFVAAMLTLIVSLTLFLREVYFAIDTLEIGFPAWTWEETNGSSSPNLPRKAAESDG